MKHVVIGASGLIGSHIMKTFTPCIGTYFSNKKEGLVHLDISFVPKLIEFFKKNQPDCIFLPAAIPGVDYCETHESETSKINVQGVQNVLQALKELQLSPKVIYFSSEYVFDGTNGPYSENDTPNPPNVYGKQKLRAEQLLRSFYKNYIIVRTVWVYGAEDGRKNFLYAVLDRTKKEKKLPVPTDELSTPTSAADLARALKELIRQNYTGIINIAGPQRMSKLDFAKGILHAFNLPSKYLDPVPSSKIPRPAQRPKNAGLKIDVLSSLGITMRSLEENLDEIKRCIK